ncbi:hypothetical protein TNIN_93121 [Trichonephila inaurata madagascariensis]|uniref:Uncharacterized protein n=1 Tax=Trichonephila inaurata madagascariensis TaxID=2747483 RepID=A0A8X7CMV5_9ARAC|nr:hypothetical protein TNIN_93121 [Trichonephila inaurata madagascariensis]
MIRGCFASLVPKIMSSQPDHGHQEMLTGFPRNKAPSFRPSLDPRIRGETTQVKSIVFYPPSLIVRWRFPNTFSLPSFDALTCTLRLRTGRGCAGHSDTHSILLYGTHRKGKPCHRAPSVEANSRGGKAASPVSAV